MRHAWTSASLLSRIAVYVLFICAIPAASAQNAAPVSGAEVYQKRCATCHDQTSSQALSRDMLQKMSAARILRTLDFGLMMGVAYPMKRDEREAVASFLGTKGGDAPPPASTFCSAGIRPMSGPATESWSGWSPSSLNTRYQPAEQAGLTMGQVRHLKLKWALGFPGDVTAFAAPTVVNGTLFVGSAGGAVQALDAKTGCLHWMFQANGPVRAALLPVRNGSLYSLVFGDLTGWVYSLDAKTGKQLWKRRVEEHEAARLTGSPVAQNGVVFVPAASWEESRSVDPQYPCCTFRGSLTALRVSDGSVVWKSYMVDPPKKTGSNSAGALQWGPSGAPVWSAPTIDAKRGLLYVTTGDNYSSPATTTSDAVMALDMKTGRIVWSQQVTANDAYTSACRSKGANCPPENGPDYDFGSSALLVHSPSGREILVAGQKSGVVYALDPDKKGKILWQTRVGKGGLNGGVQWGMASDEQKVYAAVSDVSGVMNTAGPVGGATFDPAQGGGLTALHLEDGEKAWFAPSHPCDPPRPGCSPGQSAALSLIPGVVFSGSLDGHMRAFATEDGQVVWDFDTAKEYATVNGVQAKGGSLDGAGPVIVGGMIFVNSGYPRNGGMPGNVLLAFAPED
ncbi:MAG: PQQ-binding-like beta-propeller repeat protein [Acidobacteriia bacterium]|nr:PQQ-binding-like beta-propeller repeat protein [Terriglobia bacterium]